MKTLRDFLEKLKETKEEGDTLLDRTMVFFSSNLGNASTHTRQEPAGAARRRRLQARPAPGLRPEERAAAVQPLVS